MPVLWKNLLSEWLVAWWYGGGFQLQKMYRAEAAVECHQSILPKSIIIKEGKAPNNPAKQSHFLVVV